MELNRLEKYKKKYKELVPVIDSLLAYLANFYSTKPIESNTVLTPYVVAESLKIPELEAIFLLSLADKEDIVHKKYNVWTLDDDYLLGEFKDTSSIPDRIFNNATGREVSKDNFYVDLVYELDR